MCVCVCVGGLTHRVNYLLHMLALNHSGNGLSFECEMPAKPVQSLVTACLHRAAKPCKRYNLFCLCGP